MADPMWDIVFLGGGAGAEGAIRAQRLGLQTAVVEREHIGGTMTHWGGVQVKTLLQSASFFRQAASAEAFAVRFARPVLRYDELLSRKNQITQRLADDLAERLRAVGATILQGEGACKEPGVVRVVHEGREALHRAKRIVIATGSQPNRPAGIAPDGVHILTTDDALQLREVPQSICIVGAGPAGCEFASLYSALGSQVTLLEREPGLLPQLDIDLGRELAAGFSAQGVLVYTNVSSVGVRRVSEGVQVEYVAAGQKQIANVEKVLLATGRVPYTHRLGLDRLGVAMDDKGFILVNSQLETSVAGISAVGDVVGEPMLAHRALYQAQCVAEHMAGVAQAPAASFGMVIDGLVQVATVGLSERQARERFGSDVKVATVRLRESGTALRNEPLEFGKLVFNPDGELVGAHQMGTRAGDGLSMLTLAVRQGVHAAELRGVVPEFAAGSFDQLLTA